MSKQHPYAVFMAVGKVGGIVANSTLPADFHAENLAMTFNAIGGAHEAGFNKTVVPRLVLRLSREAAQPIREGSY